MSDPIAIQLKRIRGQVDAVCKMYDEERDCTEIVRQVIATRNSLTSVARKIFSQQAKRCSAERKVEELDGLLEEMFKYY